MGVEVQGCAEQGPSWDGFGSEGRDVRRNEMRENWRCNT